MHGGVDESGRKIQLSRTVRVATRREAERALRTFVARVEAGFVRRERRTVADLLDQWHEHKSSRCRWLTTLREYRRLIEYRLKPRFGDCRCGG